MIPKSPAEIEIERETKLRKDAEFDLEQEKEMRCQMAKEIKRLTDRIIKQVLQLSNQKKEIIEKIENIAKEEIASLKHEKNHPVNKALGEDTYNMELEIAEWEDFLNTFKNIQDKFKQIEGEKK